MKRSFGFKLTLAPLAAYFVTLGALAIGHVATAGPSPDPSVTVPVSAFLTPLCVLAGCLPAVIAISACRILWRSAVVRFPAVMATAALALAWCLALTEWLALEGWREAQFLRVPLPSWLYEPKLPLWAVFSNTALVGLVWVIWACRDDRPVRRNLVLSLAYLPLWQFSVFALEEIALSGSREVAWLLELRAVAARMGTVGLFLIGLGWVVWFVERASWRLARDRKQRHQLLPASFERTTSTKADEGKASIHGVKYALTITAAAVLAVGALLPIIQFELDGTSLSLRLAAKIALVLVGVAAVVVMHFRKPRLLWLAVLPAVATLSLIVITAWSVAPWESVMLGPMLAWGFWVLALGQLLLLFAALLPQQVQADASGRVIWNPLDVEAWYYGRSSKKLVQSLTAFAFYSGSFFVGLMFFGLLGGCEERYEMPAGGGETKQIAQQVKIQKVIKKRYIINPFSAIIFNPPPIDDVKLQLNEVTQHQYRVGYGAGEGAGFAGGTAKGKVRFIRLEYAGGDWNQDFGVGADLNMLVEYHARTGHRVADRTESRTVGQLANFPIGAAPPFVYLTGQQSISLSRNEIKVLRDYLLDKHGMIFGDNGGSAHFHNQFFQMMSQVLPSVEPVRVPLDDPIHTRPYRIPFLPYVAPHGGKDAFGWKIDGRWVCYYHPGDIADAWADEHAGAKPDIVEFCYQLGVNVIFYAHVEYNKWLDARKQRDK